jgi:hypothetical protein
MEIWWILNGFMDIYRYYMGIWRSFNVLTAFIMEIWRILNGFTVFNGNMDEFYQFYEYLRHYHGNMEDIKRIYGY